MTPARRRATRTIAHRRGASPRSSAAASAPARSSRSTTARAPSDRHQLLDRDRAEQRQDRRHVTAAAAKIQPSVVTINVAGQSESGTGSGIILNTDGDILTNNHVVAVAGTSGQIQVITNDGQSAMAKIVGVDPSDDLAVIKVNGLTNLTKADFAPSSALQVGQTVVAVGAPLGLSNTVTSGIVSNTARPVRPATRAAPRSSTRSRPTPRSTRATPAARW